MTRLRQHNAMVCATCNRPVPAGDAVIRSVAFRQVAWHAGCFERLRDTRNV